MNSRAWIIAIALLLSANIGLIAATVSYPDVEKGCDRYSIPNS